MSFFYQKYIVIESLADELNKLDLSDEEKIHLSSLVDTSLHHAILDEILSNLNPSDKRVFLQKLNEDPENEELIEFLDEKIDNIEDKIRKVSGDLVKEMHEDIKESKNKK